LLRIDDLPQVACPECRRPLRFRGAQRQGVLERGALLCDVCRSRWLVADGLAHLYREEHVQGSDRLMRTVYNSFCHIHNLSVKVLLPIFQRGTEEEFREGYLPRLELGALRPRADGRPLRILEVGIGAGANLPLLRRDAPPGLAVEIWGVDLSPGMIGVLRRQLRRQGDSDVRLVLGDVHALPFPDHSFDRVFHVGGINGFRDPARALDEMARVAVPGSPIVVVDEQLDESRRPNLYHRAMFKMVTWYDNDPHAPLEAVPPEATSVVEDQLSLFFFALTFKMPAEAAAAPPGATRPAS
jgi:SAM-dependent methyltransferase